MILGFIMIFVVGRAFYQLAHEYDRNTWGYAIAGIASYYIGLFASAFILGIVIEIFWPGTITESNEKMFGFLAVPFGALVCWAFYKWLHRNWKQKSQPNSNLDTLDGDMIQNPNQTLEN